MKNKEIIISKSQYLKGLQCPKMLWLYRNRKDLAPEIDDSTQALFDQGHEIGQYAKKYFKGGVEVIAEYYDIDGAIKKTKDFIKDGKKLIFEACSKSPDGLYSRIDILKKVSGKNEWDLIEVKGSTKPKEYHFDDMASQRYAFSKGGYKIRKSILMHINNQYVRKGDINTKELFILEDCTEIVIDRMKDLKSNLEQFKNIINHEKEPKQDIGKHCSNPFECDYCDYCWAHVPEYSIYDVTSGKKLEKLLKMNILDGKDIPDDFPLGSKKLIDVTSYKTGKIRVNKNELEEWINHLKYPLFYLDYETMSFPIPVFNKTSPYKQYPFQYSLHIQKKKDGQLEHIEFLHEDISDPRIPFIKSLIKNCKKRGSVVAYNSGFEAGINKNLAEDFPEYKTELLAINDRMVDLLVPFSQRSLYHPQQHSSASLKSVLPAFCPDLKYEDLEISEGGSASRLYSEVIRELITGNEREKVYQDLKKYCELDTLAMVRLIRVIYEYL